MLEEKNFMAISAYPKRGGTPLSVIEQFKAEHGFVDLDDIEQKRKAPAAKAARYGTPTNDKTAAVKKAKAEFKAALAKLDSGKAKHRVTEPRNEFLRAAKVAKVVAKATKKTDMRVKVIAKAAKATKTKVTDSAVTQSSNTNLSQRQLAAIRRKATAGVLISGGRIDTLDYRVDKNASSSQTYDHRRIAIEFGISIVSCNRIIDNHSFFMMDNISRLPEDCKVLINFNEGSRLQTLRAITSGKMLSVNNLVKSPKSCALTMKRLARQYKLDIHTVRKGGKTIGWVMFDDSEKLEAAYKQFESVSAEVGVSPERIVEKFK